MKRVRAEHVAWLALMTSVVVVCGTLYAFRGTLLGEFHAQTFDALLDQARSFGRDGDVARAEDAFATLLDRYPDSEELLVAYAGYLESHNELGRAEEIYARAASLGRQRFSAVRRYIAFLERSGRGVEATEFLEAYLDRFPDDLTAQLDLGFAYLRIEQWQNAVAPLRRATERPDHEFAARVNLASVYARLKQIEDAIQEWRQIVGMGPGPEMQLHWQDIAAAYENLGDMAAACEAWQGYLSRFPNSIYGTQRLLELGSVCMDDIQIERIALGLKALSPVVPLNEPMAPGIWIAGVSQQRAAVSPNDTVTLEVWFQLTSTIRDPVLVRFALRDKTGSVHDLAGAPAQVGAAPLWRGDTIRQPFAIVAPGGLPAGNYQLDIGSSTSESFVTLCSIVVETDEEASS